MTTAPRSRRLRRPVVAALAAVGIGTMILSGCAAGGSSSEPTKLTYLKNTENTNTEPVFNELAENQCKTENTALPLEVSSIPQADLDSQIQLLASQNALPVMFAAAGTPAEGAKLDKAGKLLNFETELEKLGVLDDIEPAAISTIKNLYGGNFNFLPFQFNIEGIFYNKTMFAERGIEEPQTYDELVEVASQFEADGITPFTASGEQGWPITRLISSYLFRDLGPDALQKVADGDAKLTDPEYVAAAQAIADLGAAGYFDDNIASLDIDSSYNELLTGKAAMMYMGTWFLESANDPEKNTVGVDNIGFMPFPAVEGGKGSIDQYPANVGLPQTFGADTYTPKVADWLKCITENYGQVSLEQSGAISGFKSKEPVTDLPALTVDVQDRIAGSTESVLWFEALFTAKAGQDSSKNASLLVTGQLTAEDFMKLLQTDLDAG